MCSVSRRRRSASTTRNETDSICTCSFMSPVTLMPPRSLEAYQRELAALARSLAGVDFVLHGSIVKRFLVCNTDRCRCQADERYRHGPYWDWTRKVRGKTVTVRVSPGQAERLRVWIENRRRADRVLSQMEGVTLQAVKGVLREKKSSGE